MPRRWSDATSPLPAGRSDRRRDKERLPRAWRTSANHRHRALRARGCPPRRQPSGLSQGCPKPPAAMTHESTIEASRAPLSTTLEHPSRWSASSGANSTARDRCRTSAFQCVQLASRDPRADSYPGEPSRWELTVADSCCCPPGLVCKVPPALRPFSAAMLLAKAAPCTRPGRYCRTHPRVPCPLAPSTAAGGFRWAARREGSSSRPVPAQTQTAQTASTAGFDTSCTILNDVHAPFLRANPGSPGSRREPEPTRWADLAHLGGSEGTPSCAASPGQLAGGLSGRPRTAKFHRAPRRYTI